MIEYDENEGTAISYFLKLRYCVDLSRDPGYDELLEATNRNQGKRWKVLYILHIWLLWYKYESAITRMERIPKIKSMIWRFRGQKKEHRRIEQGTIPA